MIILAFILELPESPRWLILKGREEEAIEVMAALNDLETDDPFVQAEFTAVKDTVLDMSKGKFSDLFLRNEDRHLHRTLLAWWNQAMQQISGINLITCQFISIRILKMLADKRARLRSGYLRERDRSVSFPGSHSRRLQRNRILLGLMDCRVRH